MSIAYRSTLSSSGGGSGGVPIDSIEITNYPKTEFLIGENFNSTGLVVTASVGGLTGNVASECIIAPPASTFTEEDLGQHNVLVNYYGESLSYEITVRDGVEIVPWATGTDKQIAAMLAAYYNGDIDFDTIDGWDIGAERTVSIAAIDSYPATTCELVLMHKGGIDLTTSVNGHSKCAFVVGMKQAIYNGNNAIRMDNNGSATKWEDTTLRSWCNSSLLDAFPTDLKNCFKQFKNVTYNGSTKYTVNDYLSAFSKIEVCGDSQWNSFNYTDEGFWFDYYANGANQNKLSPNGGTKNYWFRSASKGNSGRFVYAQYQSSGTSTYPQQAIATGAFYLSVFGVV